MKVLLGAAIVLLALVSVGLAVYAYTENSEAAYLSLRVDHESLEDGPQWSDQDAVRVVQREFQVSISGCSQYHEESGNPDSRKCYLRDPVLRAFHPALAQMENRLVVTYLRMATDTVLANNTQWSAVYEGKQSRWRVEAVPPGWEGALAFYADERTGLVEGVAQ
jgi:hypothetical protein